MENFRKLPPRPKFEFSLWRKIRTLWRRVSLWRAMLANVVPGDLPTNLPTNVQQMNAQTLPLRLISARRILASLEKLKSLTLLWDAKTLTAPFVRTLSRDLPSGVTTSVDVRLGRLTIRHQTSSRDVWLGAPTGPGSLENALARTREQVENLSRMEEKQRSQAT